MFRKVLTATGFLVFACPAYSDGFTSKQFFSCEAGYKSWEVIWGGIPSSASWAHLNKATTSSGNPPYGNWDTESTYVSRPGGSLAPAQNQRWYRVTYNNWYSILNSYTSMCWMPLQRCSGLRAF